MSRAALITEARSLSQELMRLHALMRRLDLRATRLARAVLIAFLIFITGKSAAAETTLGGVGVPQPRDSVTALRKVDAITAEAQLLFTPILPGLPRTFVLAAVPDVQSMAIGGLGFVAALIGYHFVFGRYIRQQAGVKDTTSTSLEGQPIQVQGVVRFVAHHELEERLNGYVTGDDLHAAVQRLDEKQEANFRALDQKRSHSIGNLHEHLTGTTKALTEKIEHASSRQHDRMEAMSTTLRGEFEAKLAEVRADLGDLPGRVITLLQQTGQIGGKR